MFSESASDALVTTGSTEIMQGGVCLLRNGRSSCQAIHAGLLRRGGGGKRNNILAQKGLDRKHRKKIDLKFSPLI